jgi:hypothetical protein
VAHALHTSATALKSFFGTYSLSLDIASDAAAQAWEHVIQISTHFAKDFMLSSCRAHITAHISQASKHSLHASIHVFRVTFLILALVIPAIIINIFGILLVGGHLYPEDTPYLALVYALFIPAGVILFLVVKLHSLK